MSSNLCRVSGKPLVTVLDFGMQPLGNGFLSRSSLSEEYFYSMSVGFNNESMMLQLVHQPDPEKMFHDQYAFYSSTSNYMSRHFADFFDQVIKSDYLFGDDPFVVELGCNDGIMLKNFSKKGIRHLGIEPSINVAKIANYNGVRTVSEFFSEKLARKILEEDGMVDVFLAANVMCHIPDIMGVVKGIKCLIKPKGVVIFEDPYLGDIVSKVSYDQIYDEHVFFFSALSVRNLFSLVDMDLIDAIPQQTHGGSMRYVIAHKGAYPISDAVEKLIDDEKAMGLDQIETFVKFADNVKKSKEDLVELLTKLKRENKKVVGYGATSKSTTILNYCDIDARLIQYICDTTPIKQGKLSPGKHIPIVSYEKFKEDSVDYAFLFAWNHSQEIMNKEHDFISHGGKWITHVPGVRVV